MKAEDVTIRRMRIEELDKVQALYAELVSRDVDALSRIRVSPRQHAWEMRRVRQQWIADQKYLAYVCEGGDGVLVGYVAATIEQQARMFEVDIFANIGELWVLEEYRGRGIGGALLGALLEGVMALDIRYVSVHLPANAADSGGVVKFFEKFDFRQMSLEMLYGAPERCDG